MGYPVTVHHDELNINGNTQGYVGVPTPATYPIGAVVTVSNRGASPKTCVVTEQTATTIRLRVLPTVLPTAASAPYSDFPKGQNYGGGSDMSAYLIASNACVDMDSQVVPGRTSP